MRPKTAITLTLLTLAVCSAACAPSPAEAEQVPTPEPGRWSIIPTGVEVEPASDGGQSVTIDVAFENGTDEFSINEFETEGSYITVNGGATFPSTGLNTRSGTTTWGAGAERTTIGVPYALPPGFRARGVRTVRISYGWVKVVADTYCQLQADMAGDAPPVKLTLPDYGELELEGKIAALEFPGEAKGVTVYPVGQGAEIPDRAMLTVTRVTREGMELQGDFGEFEKVTVYVSYKNLTDSYDDTFAIHLSLIGDDGFFYELVEDDPDRLPVPRLRADAGETITWDMWYAVPPETKGLKMIATGGVDAVFDIGL